MLNEILETVNDLLEAELDDQDKLVYVNNVIKGKLLESEKLQQQITNNTKEQLANSPDLQGESLNAIVGELDVHRLMSTQALNSSSMRDGMINILLNQAGMYETLRGLDRGSSQATRADDRVGYAAWPNQTNWTSVVDGKFC